MRNIITFNGKHKLLKWQAYWRLLRLNKPVGTLLLWYPTACALWIANHGVPPISLLGLFLVGTLLMRSAGCVLNDIADRNIDKHVDRTKSRPLTNGEVSLQEAFILLILLLLGALWIAIQLPKSCFLLACIALFITCVYPFSKRFINAPQMVLGLAFSMGIPMAFVASATALSTQFYLLCLINFSWIVAYDTMYAMTDKADDLRIGVKSTAIYFAAYDRIIISILLVLMHALWLILGLVSDFDIGFYVVWLGATSVLVYQMILINRQVAMDSFRAFLLSNYYGLLMWIALILSLRPII